MTTEMRVVQYSQYSQCLLTFLLFSLLLCTNVNNCYCLVNAGKCCLLTTMNNKFTLSLKSWQDLVPIMARSCYNYRIVRSYRIMTRSYWNHARIKIVKVMARSCWNHDKILQNHGKILLKSWQDLADLFTKNELWSISEKTVNGKTVNSLSIHFSTRKLINVNWNKKTYIWGKLMTNLDFI